ncbi:class I SAM-dependent methyltransferase [Pseudomonas panipatensis]|uniref:class I SAM-dependent methyltransferase n=1 Tax=Pseudomonas panipatensis TaxID=428992 RepID=UPI0024B796E4|nr:class I SAM-dependent methyltransferase [Pseudomonas panipatensis]
MAETGRPAYLQGHAASHIHFECIDQEEKAIAYARTLLGGADVTLHMQNALRFRPGHRRFDLVWSAGLFDYLDDREFVLMLKVLSKTLRPGGE